MKRLFTLAIIAMIASLTFAQAPVQKMKASDRKIEKVVSAAQMNKAMEVKAAFDAKAKASQETATSILRKATKPVSPAFAMQLTQKQLSSAKVIRPAALGQYTMSQFKNKKGVVAVQKVAAPAKVMNVNYNANAPRMAVPKTEGEATEIVATDFAATYYASDGDWYCVIKDADNNIFYFDIVTNDPAELEIGHEYTLEDMDPSYSCMKVGSTKYAYSSATFMPKQGQYGTDYEATCVLASNGEAYHIFYTAPEPQALDVEATTAGATWYGEPDNDWFVMLSNENFEFRFDIGDQSADGLILDHEYTLADMIVDYSWGKNKATGESISYKSVSFKATTGANGTDYAATVVDRKGNTYNVTYTTVAPPEQTETVEIEFTTDETDLVDATASMGLFQFVGAKADTGFEAYVGVYANQVAGEYTYGDLELMYTSIYLDFNDYEGVQCADLTGTVTDLGNGAYKAVFEYLGTNGTLYKLTYNYGEAGDEPADVTVTKDANGIITSVEGGEPKAYTRSTDGTAYFVSNGQLSMGTQSGVVTVIEDGDKVYIKDPISRYTQGSWVEGTKSGNMIVVPAAQPLAYSDEYDATISLRYGVITAAGSIAAADDYAENFVFTVDGDTWTLENTAAWDQTADAYYMGAFWDDDDSATGYGDAETVLTYDPTYVAPSTDLVELPAGAEVNEWNMSGVSVTSSSQTPFQNQAVNVAFVGNDVYVQGVFSAFPEAWIKGTKSGSTVTFSKLQYIGNYGGSYDMYFAGTDGEGLTDATATLSADAQTLTFNESLLANAATDRIYYLTWLDNVVISAVPAEEPVITDLTATIPYVNTFDTEAEQAEAAIYDANGDGKTFTFNAPSGGDNTTTAARYAYSSANEGNDYVVFPGLELVAGTSYKVSVDARAYGTSFPERFEVVAGTVAKASELSTTVIEPTDVTTGTYATYTAEFVPEADGVYYFAIHAISDADMFYLYTDNFSVKTNDPNAPKAVTNVTVTPDANAALIAEVNFTAPATTAGGAAIEGGVDVKISRDGEEVETVTVGPGTEFGYTDNKIEAPGNHTWTLVAIVNGLQSDPVSASAYVGEDTPDDVENLVAADIDGKVALSWDAPVDGVLGGIILPENLTYNVYPAEMIEFWGMVFPSIDFENPYVSGLTETSTEVEFDTNSGEQTYTYFGVTAENTAGESNGAMAAVLTGAPYELPFVEEFPNGNLSYWWGVNYDDNIYDADGGLGITTEGELVFQAPVEGWISLMSGKIALNGAENPALSFSYKANAAASLQVQVVTPEGEEIVGILPVEASDEYATATIDLGFYADQPWVRFYLVGEFEDATELFVDNLIVMDMVQNDLQIAVSAPKSVTAGKAAVVKATVKNVGQAVAENYEVKFYVNDNEAPTPMFETPALAFMETAEFEFELETSIFDEAGDVTVKAEVVFDADEKDADNADEVVVEVVAPSATPVESVTAEETEEGVLVSWTVAENAAQEVTEDFESYEGNTVYADGESCGPWAAVDLAPGDSYFWNSEAILWPHWENPYSFGIMNFEMSALTESFEAVSGDQAVIFMSNTTAADKYMISSELPGVAQTISFQARPITAQYGAETFEVLASSTDTNPASFTKVADFSTDTEDWLEFSANLPEGTKYFAIHYTSNDIFGLFIDDLKYTVGGGVPTGFNVYVDQMLVAATDGEATSYVYEEELSEGEHEFSVTAVYGASESAPVSVTLGVTTGIKNIVDAQNVEVYTVDGIRMNNVKNLKAGVYVVNGQKVVIK